MSESGLTPGWYPHQDTPNAMRYWDGEKWTDNLAPAPSAPVVPHQPSKVSDALVLCGFVTMIFLPIAGFVIGAIVTAKGKVGYGVLMLVVSAIASVYWYSELAATSG